MRTGASARARAVGALVLDLPATYGPFLESGTASRLGSGAIGRLRERAGEGDGEAASMLSSGAKPGILSGTTRRRGNRSRSNQNRRYCTHGSRGAARTALRRLPRYGGRPQLARRCSDDLGGILISTPGGRLRLYACSGGAARRWMMAVMGTLGVPSGGVRASSRNARIAGMSFGPGPNGGRGGVRTRRADAGELSSRIGLASIARGGGGVRARRVTFRHPVGAAPAMEFDRLAVGRGLDDHGVIADRDESSSVIRSLEVAYERAANAIARDRDPRAARQLAPELAKRARRVVGRPRKVSPRHQQCAHAILAASDVPAKSDPTVRQSLAALERLRAGRRARARPAVVGEDISTDDATRRSNDVAAPEAARTLGRKIALESTSRRCACTAPAARTGVFG